VAIARAKHPIPSRTRQLSAVAPMVLRLKTWESRSPPNLKRSILSKRYHKTPEHIPQGTVAGWSSPVARQAHNLKVTGSNPVPATKKINNYNALRPAFRGASCCPNSRSTIGQQNRPRWNAFGGMAAEACPLLTSWPKGRVEFLPRVLRESGLDLVGKRNQSADMIS
jgi:hypothetical protein